MRDFIPEFKLSILAVSGVAFSLQDINAILQTCILLLSFVTASIAFYKALKHKSK